MKVATRLCRSAVVWSDERAIPTRAELADAGVQLDAAGRSAPTNQGVLDHARCARYATAQVATMAANSLSTGGYDQVGTNGRLHRLLYWLTHGPMRGERRPGQQALESGGGSKLTQSAQSRPYSDRPAKAPTASEHAPPHLSVCRVRDNAIGGCACALCQRSISGSTRPVPRPGTIELGIVRHSHSDGLVARTYGLLAELVPQPHSVLPGSPHLMVFQYKGLTIRPRRVQETTHCPLLESVAFAKHADNPELANIIDLPSAWGIV